jgi:hypothetical protein
MVNHDPRNMPEVWEESPPGGERDEHHIYDPLCLFKMLSQIPETLRSKIHRGVI